MLLGRLMRCIAIGWNANLAARASAGAEPTLATITTAVSSSACAWRLARLPAVHTTNPDPHLRPATRTDVPASPNALLPSLIYSLSVALP
jgi:hypothetical protein